VFACSLRRLKNTASHPYLHVGSSETDRFYLLRPLRFFFFVRWSLLFHLVQVANCCSQCSVWIARKPPGFAFIDFDDRRDAEDAIRDLDGMLEVSFG
jgi:hypothetical protein